MSLEKAKKYLEQGEFRMKKAAIVACSNAKEFQYRPQIDDLTDYLHSVGIEAELSDCIFSDDSVFSGTPRERAAQLMKVHLTLSATSLQSGESEAREAGA